MKARRIALDGMSTPQSAIQRVISVRFAEVLAQTRALSTQRPDELHAFRIGCKRLRYSLELFAEALPRLESAKARIRQLQDELGEVHDCDVLSAMAKHREATHLLRRLMRDRDRHAARARALWLDAFAQGGPFNELIAFTGFGAVAP